MGNDSRRGGGNTAPSLLWPQEKRGSHGDTEPRTPLDLFPTPLPHAANPSKPGAFNAIRPVLDTQIA